MRYPILERTAALEILAKRAAAEDFSPEEFVTSRGNGPDFDDSFISPLSEKLAQLREKFPKTLALRDQEGGRFEAEACSIVHQAIPRDLVTAVTDHDFWRYLTVIHFSDLVEWRHSAGGEAVNPNNFGIGNTKRNLLYRMWMRAELSFDASANDPYCLSRFGDKDFWESHIIGVRTGNARATVRSLVRYLFPSELKGKCSLKTIQVRQLAKRITRLRSNVMLEIYPEQMAIKLLAREAERVKAVVEKTNA